MTTPPTVTFVFDSTNAALWAEDVAVIAGLPVEVVPAPADSHAKCDIALKTYESVAGPLAEAFTREGVAHRLWRPEL